MSHWVTNFDERLLWKAVLACKNPEAVEQALVVKWAQEVGERLYPDLDLLIAIPNDSGYTGGFGMNAARAAQAKRLGVKSGPSDLQLPVPRRGPVVAGSGAGDEILAHGIYAGLWIEMKVIQKRPHPRKPGQWQVKLGDVKDTQVQWLERMRKQGYASTIAWSAEEAQAYLRIYLDGLWQNPPMKWLLGGARGWEESLVRKGRCG